MGHIHILPGCDAVTGGEEPHEPRRSHRRIRRIRRPGVAGYRNALGVQWISERKRRHSVWSGAAIPGEDARMSITEVS